MINKKSVIRIGLLTGAISFCLLLVWLKLGSESYQHPIVAIAKTSQSSASQSTESRPPPFPEIYRLLTHSDTPENAFLISGDKVGFVEFWATADKVREKYGEDHAKMLDLQLEGMPSPVLNVYLIDGDTTTVSLVCELRDGTNVDRISIYDTRFKTAKGIGIGSKLGDLRKAYAIDWIDVGEGDLCARVEEMGMTFWLAGEPPAEFYSRRDGSGRRDMSLVPDDMEIRGIMLTGRSGVAYGDPLTGKVQ